MARPAKLTILAVLSAIAAISYWLFDACSSPSLVDTISSSLPAHSRWALPPPSPEERNQVQAILSQPFTYLGEGAQAIAFQSEDGQYVLKLFKMRRFTPSWLDHLCPHVVRRRWRNLQWVFNGYTNAYRDLRNETGLVWIHLAKTCDLQQSVCLTDQKGRRYHIDADTTEFVLQEKAELIFKRLARLYQAGNDQQAQQAIGSILQLIQYRIQKGYADRDKAVSNNYGFVGDRPVQLDLGRLYQGDRAGQLEHVQQRIERWKRETLE